MSKSHELHRAHLPIPSKKFKGYIAYDGKDPDSKFPPIKSVHPPDGAPNVLLILIDDAGFGSSSAFGGPCYTPNAEKLAAPHVFDGKISVGINHRHTDLQLPRAVEE